MKKGDIVTRNSYNNDIIFRVAEIIDENTVGLIGIKYRLKTYVDVKDLNPVRLSALNKFKQAFKEDMERRIEKIIEKRKLQDFFAERELMPGKVLHIDADKEYLKLCMDNYAALEVTANGENIAEKKQPEKISEVLRKYMPDILVITGHDSLSDKQNKDNPGNYKSSAYFIETVKNARWANPSKDSLIIIAGACQSYYEGLIEAGANIASSPERILIHALDPVLVAERVAYTPVGERIGLEQALENTITGLKGMGGYEVMGTLRKGKLS